MLYMEGRQGALINKLDYEDAYKHIHVRRKDLKLQVVQWGGKNFVEMKLIFGSKSSPGIFDEMAKVFLWCTMTLSGLPRGQVQ